MTPETLRRLLADDPAFRAPLQALHRLGLPDAWIGAGFVRNAVWDALHGRTPLPQPDSDLDVVFHGPGDATAEPLLEARLHALAPGLAWSVRDQGRMHRRHGDAPYRDTADALCHWTETATAIAARLDTAGQVELLAPLGLEDLFGLVLRPTPVAAADPVRLAAFHARIEGRGWLRRWPRLRLTADAPPAPAPSPSACAPSPAGRSSPPTG
ncbi:nucleotidyltransferase family protein [Pseudoroseomonas cervicalis]|uniref:nucleotidyltransferase family protein n=1 Tax=Teichococcus cervicalis TaxID=204525 RepID=UPI0022F16AB5|nr:nucleotidyltransferase family protein [Pseudoroseomonas cervicalis]WBV42455.1 nucleotidyltransferase family protein [Pseudoroseomonas cervicalis]